MREFDYPFDSKYIMRKRRALKRELLKDSSKMIKKRIAVLGGSTTNDLVDVLELFLLDYGIEPVFYQSEYGMFWEDAVFGNELLETFNPDIVFVYTTNRNISVYPQIGDSPEHVEEMLVEEIERYKSMWDKLTERYHCPIIQNNFDPPQNRVVGNKSVSACWGSVNYIMRLNQLFSEYASSHDTFYINDINYQAATIGLNNWFDPFVWFMYKYAISLDAIPTVAFNVANIIKSIYGKNKKAIAVDLDNTLWGGVVGDDGVDGIIVGHETSQGQMYEEFQEYLKSIKASGVILNVISKNDEENAKSGINHPGMVLKKEDFITIKANWEPKSQNLIDMANDLSLGVDSFVFVDDNPAEREIIRQQVPGVGIPELEKPEKYARSIDGAGYFEMTSFSTDDANRNKMYKENAARASIKRQFDDYNDYLRSLEMVAEIGPFKSAYLDRIAQLTNKSNQFNLTTKRCTRDEIEMMANSDQFITLYGRLKDKFGDNGVVSVVVGEIKGDRIDIILWLMSCRVLKRDFEYAMMDEFVKISKEKGVKEIIGYYYPTIKNGMVKDFYALQGFEKKSEDDVGNSTWNQVIDSYELKNKVIKFEE